MSLTKTHTRRRLAVATIAAAIAFTALINLAESAPVARVTAPRTRCVAPCAVFFDARGSSDSSLGPP